jgi:glutathione S-transferase
MPQALTAEYLGKNPMGRMPLLELDDGTFIAESVAICRQRLLPALGERGRSVPEIGSAYHLRILAWNSTTARTMIPRTPW